MISLVLMILLISSTIKELTHTISNRVSVEFEYGEVGNQRTLFPNQRIITVVGIVGISRRRASSIS